MSDYPNLMSYGYHIEAELGRNREGGRITWKATDIKTQKPVVIKQFCFAQDHSSWSGYKTYGQELNVLQKLKHPNIPQYLTSIETDDGFCLVQEYIAASPCNLFRPLTIAEVRQVAAKLLDILIYLQQQTPPVFHRDLSTGNILLDDSLDGCLNVYLIDFGLSSLGSKEISASSVFQGTPGFIAPEQIIQPTMASDIYGLGVSLVCLLAYKDISEVRACTIADNPYQLNLKQFLPELDRQERQLLNWLKKMTNAKVSQRFPNAQAAKNALLEVELSDSSILPVSEFEATTINTLSPTSSYIKPQIIAGVAITGVAAIATWGIGFTASRVALSIPMILIAVVATVAIAITQLGAATIVNSDPQAKFQGIALGVIIPLLLVGLSGLIWGMEQAVTISEAIALGEILLLVYFGGQLPSKMSKLAQGGLWVGAIAIGISLGLNLN
ncbi:MAG: serine/threonine protein kinase [Waterburya sp.]